MIHCLFFSELNNGQLKLNKKRCIKRYINTYLKGKQKKITVRRIMAKQNNMNMLYSNTYKNKKYTNQAYGGEGMAVGVSFNRINNEAFAFFKNRAIMFKIDSDWAKKALWRFWSTWVH